MRSKGVKQRGKIDIYRVYGSKLNHYSTGIPSRNPRIYSFHVMQLQSFCEQGVFIIKDWGSWKAWLALLSLSRQKEWRGKTREISKN
jgi:hypothetical protein